MRNRFLNDRKISLTESLQLLERVSKLENQNEKEQATAEASEEKNAQRFQTIIDKLKQNKSYTEFTKELGEMMNGDPKTANALSYCMRKGLLDDNVRVTGKSIPVTQLHPTQREIGLEASVKWPLLNPEKDIPKIADKKGVIIGKGNGAPIVVLNESLVLDGHHRWSEAFCVDPGCTILAYNVSIPSLGTDKESAKKALMALQMAIAAVAKKLPSASVPKDDINLLTANDKEIEARINLILDSLKDLKKKNADALNKAFNTDEYTEDTVAKYYFKNCMTLLTSNKGRGDGMPARTVMPLTDATQNDGSESTATVMQVLNLGAPKAIVGKGTEKEEVKESYRRRNRRLRFYENYDLYPTIEDLDWDIKHGDARTREEARRRKAEILSHTKYNTFADRNLDRTYDDDDDRYRTFGGERYKYYEGLEPRRKKS